MHRTEAPMHDNHDESRTARRNGSKGEKLFTVFLMVACAALAVLVLLLAMQNRRLKEQLSTLLTPQMPPDALREGNVLEPLALLDEGGNRIVLSFEGAGEQTLLLFFSPDCPACRETIPVWSALLQSRPLEVRVAGVRLGGEVEDVPNLPFTVYTPEDGGKSLGGKIPFVPATILLDDGGAIERVWYGMLDEGKQSELRDALAGSS